MDKNGLNNDPKKPKPTWKLVLSGDYEDVKKKDSKHKKENISDKQGRALEYIIVEEIKEKQPKKSVKLTEAAVKSQIRDKEKFETLLILRDSIFNKVLLFTDYYHSVFLVFTALSIYMKSKTIRAIYICETNYTS